MGEVWTFIKFFNQAWPLIKGLFDQWKQTPDDLKADQLNKIRDAIIKSNQTGNTSDEESLIHNGRPRSPNP